MSSHRGRPTVLCRRCCALQNVCVPPTPAECQPGHCDDQKAPLNISNTCSKTCALWWAQYSRQWPSQPLTIIILSLFLCWIHSIDLSFCSVFFKLKIWCCCGPNSSFNICPYSSLIGLDLIKWPRMIKEKFLLYSYYGLLFISMGK